ncbi:MAG: hypothetical protein ACOYJS_01405 [Acutalibacteraceae bacterium]
MKKKIYIFLLFICLWFFPIKTYSASPPATLLRGDGSLVGAYASVQEAVDAIAVTAGDSFIVEIAEGTVTDSLDILQQPNKSVVIRPESGASVVFTNTITIDGNGNIGNPETLLIQGFSFDFTSGAFENCIYFNLIPPRTGHCYPHNVTINGCNFTGIFDTTVAVQSIPGGLRNISITNCTATNMHSLAQLKSVSGYAFIQNCVLSNSSGGVNFYGTGDLVVDSCNLSVEGYAVRSGQGSGAIQNIGSVTINNSILNSNSSEDGTIVLRGTSADIINIFHSNITNASGAIIQNLNAASAGLYKITISESNLSGNISGVTLSTVNIIDDPNVQNGPICINNGSDNSIVIAAVIIVIFILVSLVAYCICRCFRSRRCRKYFG